MFTCVTKRIVVYRSEFCRVIHNKPKFWNGIDFDDIHTSHQYVREPLTKFRNIKFDAYVYAYDEHPTTSPSKIDRLCDDISNTESGKKENQEKKATCADKGYTKTNNENNTDEKRTIPNSPNVYVKTIAALNGFLVSIVLMLDLKTFDKRRFNNFNIISTHMFELCMTTITCGVGILFGRFFPLTTCLIWTTIGFVRV